MSCTSANAHLLDSARIQDWKDTANNLEVKFRYSPEKPIIDAFTKLEFSVTDLKTGEHIQNFTAHVTVTNGQAFQISKHYRPKWRLFCRLHIP